jgi:hypothetical protein
LKIIPVAAIPLPDFFILSAFEPVQERSIFRFHHPCDPEVKASGFRETNGESAPDFENAIENCRNLAFYVFPCLSRISLIN